MSRSSCAAPRLQRFLAIGCLATWIAVPACDRTPVAQAKPVRTIALLGGRVFDGGDRVAALLNDMAEATDVVGNSRFVVATAPGARPAELATLLAQQPEAAVAIAFVGDLAVLESIDPSLEPQALGRLSSRVMDEAALNDSLARLEQEARTRGVTLLLATAPLGRQARIEVPELLQVAQILRRRGPVLDVGRTFAALESALLFSNGIDRLDDFGHDELARALFELLCHDPGSLPPRDAAEAAARREARALAAWRADRQEEFLVLAEQVLAEPAFSSRHAARLAAIATVRDGWEAGCKRWEVIVPPAAGAVPGLALGRLLCELAEPAAAGAVATGIGATADSGARDLATFDIAGRDADPLEAELARVLVTLRSGDSDARQLAEACVDAHPERIEAWMVLQLVSIALLPLQDVRAEMRAQLELFPRSAVAPSLVEHLAQSWPDLLAALPALALGARPFARLGVTGPLLETARRRASIGYIDHALEWLRDGMHGRRLPATWKAETARIAALPRG